MNVRVRVFADLPPILWKLREGMRPIALLSLTLHIQHQIPSSPLGTLLLTAPHTTLFSLTQGCMATSSSPPPWMTAVTSQQGCQPQASSTTTVPCQLETIMIFQNKLVVIFSHCLQDKIHTPSQPLPSLPLQLHFSPWDGRWQGSRIFVHSLALAESPG